MKLIQLLITIAIGAVLTACAVQGYEGPALPDSETALIQTSNRTAGGGSDLGSTGAPGFYLTSVDGKELRNVTGVQVLPGRRCIELLIRAQVDGTKALSVSMRSLAEGTKHNSVLLEIGAVDHRLRQSGLLIWRRMRRSLTVYFER